MRIKYALAMSTTALFLAAGAQAQQTPPAGIETSPSTRAPSVTAPSATAPDRSSASLPASSLIELKDDKAMVSSLQVNRKDLADMDIYGSDGKKIGEVDKVLGDNTNAIKAVTMDVGGFLGIGSREVVIPIDRLQKGTEKNRLQVSMTKAEIEKLEDWRSAPRDASGRSPAPATTSPSAPAAPVR